MRSFSQRVPESFGGWLMRFAPEPRHQPLGGTGTGAIGRFEWQQYRTPMVRIGFDPQMGNHFASPEYRICAVITRLDNGKPGQTVQFNQ